MNPNPPFGPPAFAAAVFENHRRRGRRFRARGRDSPPRSRGRQRSRSACSRRLRRPRHRGGAQCARHLQSRARSSSSRWPMSSRTSSTAATGRSTRSFRDQVTVTDDRKFIGFDGYQHAMDQLKPGDVVILTTPLAFRWVHFKYAIRKGLECLHGKAADGGWPDFAPHARAGGGSFGQEPEGRRWADVAP